MADRAFLERMSRELADQGKLIEAGWVAFRLLALPQDVSPVQLDNCRMAFMAGSQHLFSSINAVLDHGDAEPTDADLRKMSLINEELQAFYAEMELRVAKSKGSA
jgi:hypothetical protein